MKTFLTVLFFIASWLIPTFLLPSFYSLAYGLLFGYYGILDNLDNCIIECYPTKEEAEKEAEILNGFTDGNGRLKTVI